MTHPDEHDLAARLIAADTAARALAERHDPAPLRHLLEADPLAGWALGVLYAHVVEHGLDDPLGQALASLAADLGVTA